MKKKNKKTKLKYFSREIWHMTNSIWINLDFLFLSSFLSSSSNMQQDLYQKRSDHHLSCSVVSEYDSYICLRPPPRSTHTSNRIGLTGLALASFFLLAIVSSHFSSSCCFLLDYSITGSLFSMLHCAVSEAKEEKDHEGYVFWQQEW